MFHRKMRNHPFTGLFQIQTLHLSICTFAYSVQKRSPNRTKTTWTQDNTVTVAVGRRFVPMPSLTDNVLTAINALLEFITGPGATALNQFKLFHYRWC
jgi:hypothetical protein